MLSQILIHSAISFLKLFPIVIVAVLISQLIKRKLATKDLHKKLKESTASEGMATIIGILTPGPLIGFLPILKELARKGIPPSIIAAFITGQTLIGPVRLFLETGYFGWKFFAIRVTSALIMGIIIGLVFKLAEKLGFIGSQ